MLTKSLLEHIYGHSREEAVVFLCGLDEPQRKKLAKIARTEYRKIDKLQSEVHPESKQGIEQLQVFLEENEVYFKPKFRKTPDYMANATLAVLACCAKTDVLKITSWMFQLDNDIIAILDARKPDWTQDWIARLLSQEWTSVTWPLVSYCLLNQLITRPTSDNYISLMQWGIYDTWGSEPTDSILAALQQQPWLFEYEIPRIFEVDEWFFDDKYNDQPQKSWTIGLAQYVENEPSLKRELLHKCLSGLLLHLKNPVHQGFIRFYNAVQLNIEDKKPFQQTFLALLSHEKSFIRGFALQELSSLYKSGELTEVEQFVTNSHEILSKDVKSQQKSCLALMTKILKQHPEYSEIYLQSITRSLMTTNAEMQDQFLAILEDHKNILDSNCMAFLQEMETFIPHSLETRYKALAGNTPEEITEKQASQIPLPEAELSTGIAHLSKDECKLIGIEYAKDSGLRLNGCSDLHFLSINELETVEPLDSIQGLLDFILDKMEYVVEAEDFDLILDGISRLHSSKPEDFTLLADSIRSRLEAIPTEKGMFSCRFGVYALNRLVLFWIAKHDNIGKHDWYRERDRQIARIYKLRVAEVRARLEDNIVAPLLSLPDYKGGWIKPESLQERLNYYLDRQIDIPKYDFEQAILRLWTATSRQKAMTARQDNIYSRLLSYALGNDEQFDDLDESLMSVWIAAVEVSQRRSSHQAPKHPGWTDLLKKCFAAPQYTWKLEVPEHWKQFYHDENEGPSEWLTLSSNHKFHNYPRVSDSITLIYKESEGLEYAPLYWIRKAFTICPYDIDSIYAGGCTAIQKNIDAEANSETHYYAFFENIGLTQNNPSPVVYRLLCLGMLAKNHDTSTAAAEALSRMVAKQSLDHRIYSTTLLVFYQAELVKLVRLVKLLSDVANTSSRHALWVKELIEDYIIRMEDKPHAFHLLLELLFELHCLFQSVPSEKLAYALGNYTKGKSKLTTVCKSLLALKGEVISHKIIVQQHQNALDRIASVQRSKDQDCFVYRGGKS